MTRWMRVLQVFLATGVVLPGAAIGAGNTVAGAAGTTNFPYKPVRILVGNAPGGSTDVLARIYAAGLAPRWGQPVLVENRAGASGTIGASVVASATPDGHTLLFIGNNLATPPEGYKLSYDPIKSFIPISLVASSPSVLYVTPSLPVNSLKELIALAKAKPGQMNFSTAGSGSLQFHIMKLLMNSAKIDMVHVPYNGGAPALAAVMSGEVQATIGSHSGGVPLVQAGKLKALVVTSSTRSPKLPEVPTMAEAANMPGFYHLQWFGVLAPKGTPQEIIARAHRDIVEITRSPEAQRALANLGFTAVANTPAEYARIINNEVRQFWGPLYGK